jgi:dUTP pyrophosphatase
MDRTTMTLHALPEPGHPVLRVALDDPQAQMPTQAHLGDAGMDLYVSEAVRIEPGVFVDVECGIRVQLPDGYWARITGRSSTLRRRGLLVSEAVIDGGYIVLPARPEGAGSA